jgi:hypothetical protein
VVAVTVTEAVEELGLVVEKAKGKAIDYVSRVTGKESKIAVFDN